MNAQARRTFRESLSMVLILTAALSAFLIISDPDVMIDLGRLKIHFTGDTFSQDTKGAVIASILIAGYNAVTGYWLPSRRRATDSEAPK